jgi:hypothetical protein
LELVSVEGVVVAFLGEELLMRSAFEDVALFDDEDAIGDADWGKAFAAFAASATTVSKAVSIVPRLFFAFHPLSKHPSL